MAMHFDSLSSIPKAFYEIADRSADSEVYSQAVVTSGDAPGSPRSWESVTYGEAKSRVLKVAHSLSSIGVRRGDKVAIISTSRPEWMIADLAALSLGAVVTSVYQTLAPDDIGYILFDAGADVVFAENQEQVDKLIELAQRKCPIPATEEREAREVQLKFRKIITFEAVSGADELVVDYREILKNENAGIPDAVGALQRSDLATLVYTSGTTGPPKGVMQTHGNHLANIRQAFQAGLVSDEATIMLFLPLAHSFAKLMGYIGFLATPRLKFPAIPDRRSSRLDPASVTRDIREGSATVVPIVPRLLEKMASGVERKASGGGLSAKILKLALWAGREVRAAEENSSQAPLLAKISYGGTESIRAKVKAQLFGSQFRYCVSGGAKLNPDVHRFFDSLGIEILEGYGLTETCVATNVNRLGKKKIGSVGPVLAPDIEMKLEADGEICFRGPNVTLGYYNRKSATESSWDGAGWFHTGDLGSVDAEGYLTIAGRKKEILVSSYGKKVAPSRIEALLQNSRYIAQAVLFGDGKPYCVALLALDAQVVREWAEKNGVTLEADPAKSERVETLIREEVAEVNQKLSSFEEVKKIALTAEEFTIDNGLLTPTFKVKRGAVYQKYKEPIERLYSRGD